MASGRLTQIQFAGCRFPQYQGPGQSSPSPPFREAILPTEPLRSRVPRDQLTREVLLPAAAAGLDAWGVDADDRDRYLGVIEARVRSGRTGAAWQTEAVRYLEEHGLERIAALREMTRRYAEHACTGAPVHEWPVP